MKLRSTISGGAAAADVHGVCMHVCIHTQYLGEFVQQSKKGRDSCKAIDYKNGCKTSENTETTLITYYQDDRVSFAVMLFLSAELPSGI